MQNFCIEQLHTPAFIVAHTNTHKSPLSHGFLPLLGIQGQYDQPKSAVSCNDVRAWASHLIAVSVQSLSASPYLSVRIHMLRAVTASQYHCTSPSPRSSLWQPEKWFTRKLCLLLKGQSINLVRASSWRVCKRLKARSCTCTERSTDV